MGQTDMAVEDARRLLGRDAVIGLSIKTSAAGRGRAHRADRLRRDRRRVLDCIEGQSRSADRHRWFVAKSPECCGGGRRSLPLCAIAGIDAGMLLARSRRVPTAWRSISALCAHAAIRGGRARAAPNRRQRARRREAAYDSHCSHHRGIHSAAAPASRLISRLFRHLAFTALGDHVLDCTRTPGVAAIHDAPADFIAAEIDAVSPISSAP